MAVDVLKSKGVPEDRILFLNLIASPEGVTSFATRFPKLRVVTAFVDQGLDEKKYVAGQTTQGHTTDSFFQLHRSGTGRFWGSVLYSVKVVALEHHRQRRSEWAQQPESACEKNPIRFRGCDSVGISAIGKEVQVSMLALRGTNAVGAPLLDVRASGSIMYLYG